VPFRSKSDNAAAINVYLENASRLRRVLMSVEDDLFSVG
jgi:hypothetical protein